MFPVVQQAFVLAAFELADGNFLGHLRDRDLHPVKQLSEHGNPPHAAAPVQPGINRIFSWLLLRTLSRML